MAKPTTARYLLRFDDLCPAMDWSIWSDIEALLIEKQLQPLLAVVPDNRDPTLNVGPAATDFWERVRAWQRRGWTIALHGYQHTYVTRHAGIVGVRKKSEFAGLPAAEQEEKLRRGIEIFRREGIKPEAWIAPGNSFDAITVSLLSRLGIRVISDGYFRFPFRCRRGIDWIPQQLFYFRPAPIGVWTVCYHHNQWTAADRQQFRADLDRYQPDLCSLNDVLEWYGDRPSAGTAWLCTRPRLSRLLIRCQLKLWNCRRAGEAPQPRGNEVSPLIRSGR